MQVLGQTVVGTVVSQVGTVAAVEHRQLTVFLERLQQLLSLLLALVLNQFHGIGNTDGQRVGVLGQRGVYFLVEHVGAKATCTDGDRLTLKLAQHAGQLKEFQCLLQCDGLQTQFLGQVGKLWLLLVLGRTNLYQRTETANLHEDGLAALGVDTQLALTGLVL